MFGKRHSQQAKEKISTQRKKNNDWMKNEEYRYKMSIAVSGELNGMYGKRHSKEAKQKMSEAKKGKKLLAENGNAKQIVGYEDKEHQIPVLFFNTIKEALIFLETKSKDYSGITKCMNENRKYKGYYWQKV